MRKTEEDQSAKLLKYCKSIIVFGIIGFFVSLLFLFIAALCISGGMLAAELQSRLGVVACVLGSFVAGTGAVRQCHERGLLIGIGVAVVLFLLQLTMGLLLYDTVSFEHNGLGLLCGDLCGGAAAGILHGERRKTHKKKRRSRRPG